jgi:hypothetical protein
MGTSPGVFEGGAFRDGNPPKSSTSAAPPPPRTETRQPSAVEASEQARLAAQEQAARAERERLAAQDQAERAERERAAAEQHETQAREIDPDIDS